MPSVDGLREKYKKEVDQIRLEFLDLVINKIDGYFISFENICKWLEDNETFEKYNTDKIYRRHFLDRNLRNNNGIIFNEAKDEDDKNKYFIMRKECNQVRYPWFSSDGFKAYCMMSKKPKGALVRAYFIEVEKDYVRALSQTFEQNAAELKSLKEDLAKTKIELAKQTKCADKLLDIDGKNAILIQNMNKYSSVKRMLKEVDVYAYNMDPIMVEAMYYRYTYAKKVHLYIVNHEFMQSKKRITKDKKPIENTFGINLDSGSETENANVEPKNSRKPVTKKVKEGEAVNNLYSDDVFYEDNYDNVKSFDEFELFDIEESGDYHDKPLYYHIGAFTGKLSKNENYKFIDYLYVVDKNHLEMIKNHLNDEKINDKYAYKTAKANIYNISYASLLDKRNTTLANYLHDKHLQDK